MQKSENALCVDQYVSYRHNGIYKILEICNRDFGGNGSKKYYLLQSVYDHNAKIYVPADTENLPSAMKHILTSSEINEIIAQTNQHGFEWIEDSTEREQKFSKIVESGNKKDILMLLRTLSSRKSLMAQQKKKLYSADEKLLSLAEKIISEEFAFALGIKKDEVLPYISGFKVQNS
ncbi:MAG: hypothetical protein E7510_01370 [Ruminococcus sp.]|nr:hypothetical protein [Ruminococcus sp.]